MFFKSTYSLYPRSSGVTLLSFFGKPGINNIRYDWDQKRLIFYNGLDSEDEEEKFTMLMLVEEFESLTADSLIDIYNASITFQ